MARKKTEPKPIFAVKFDFVESLDAFCEAAMFLHQAVTIALELKQVSEPVASKLREANAKLERAMTRDED